jgi:uroporphyrinogen decarboxylase
MTGRDRMRTTLRLQMPDRPPHFEPMFELEREAFGLSFPDRSSWAGMTPKEKEAAVARCMEIYARIVERFEWDALMVYWPWSDPDGVRAAARCLGDRVLVGGVVGAGVWSIEVIKDWPQFAQDLFDAPEKIHAGAEEKCQAALTAIDRLIEAGADFIFMPNDVAFNAGPFMRPEQFAEFVTPYLARQVRRVKDRGAFAIIHTDGQIMPILDQLAGLGADCLHSIDPMAGVDIAEVKRLTCGRMGLMGNVQCSLLQDGPDEAIRRSALYCLEHASPGGGYVFGTSNTIFPGMPLKNYEYMLKVFRDFCATHAGTGETR